MAATVRWLTAGWGRLGWPEELIRLRLHRNLEARKDNREMLAAYTRALKNYANFRGRDRRSEFWLFFLAQVIVFIIGLLLSRLYSAFGVIALLYLVATVLPLLAAEARRLHDTDKSAWWILSRLIPVVGSVLLLVFLAFPGTQGGNRFGPQRD